MTEGRIGNLADVEAFEKIPLNERLKAFNTYDLIKSGVDINPDAFALSFILSGENYKEPIQVNYRDFLAKVTQTANLFYDLGIKPNELVSIFSERMQRFTAKS